MRNLNYQLKSLCRRNRDGSYATRVDRERQLTAIANQLFNLGYRGMSAHSLRQKHVQSLVDLWLDQQISAGTIKNRMAHMRWWAEKVNRSSVIARSNIYYGIPDRQFVSPLNKAVFLDDADFQRVSDPFVRMSLRLQQAFGLRREEAIKICPNWADRQTYLRLKSGWTKGGRARTIPIISDEQRAVLDAAKNLAGWGSLIPSDLTYVRQLRRYEHACANAGLSKMHGLRHAYAQARYRVLTGWDCPNAGGPNRPHLSADQRRGDRVARLQISAELGHEREQITAVYLGR